MCQAAKAVQLPWVVNDQQYVRPAKTKSGGLHLYVMTVDTWMTNPSRLDEHEDIMFVQADRYQISEEYIQTTCMMQYCMWHLPQTNLQSTLKDARQSLNRI